MFANLEVDHATPTLRLTAGSGDVRLCDHSRWIESARDVQLITKRSAHPGQWHANGRDPAHHSSEAFEDYDDSGQKGGVSRTTADTANEDEHLFWGNILFFGGLYSSTTDYAPDAMIEYLPNMYYITLNPLPHVQSHNGGLGTEREAHARIEPERNSAERRVRTYVVRNHRSLISDISKGRGECLSSLCSLLRLSESGDTVRRSDSSPLVTLKPLILRMRS